MRESTIFCIWETSYESGHVCSIRCRAANWLDAAWGSGTPCVSCLRFFLVRPAHPRPYPSALAVRNSQCRRVIRRVVSPMCTFKAKTIYTVSCLFLSPFWCLCARLCLVIYTNCTRDYRLRAPLSGPVNDCARVRRAPASVQKERETSFSAVETFSRGPGAMRVS